MAAGKNKIGRWFTIAFDDSGAVNRDLTASLVPGSVKGGGLVLDQVDMTGNNNAVHSKLAGAGVSQVTAQFYLDDTAATGAHTVLSGMMGKGGLLKLDWGAGAAPATGDPEWSGQYTLLQADVAENAGRPVISAMWEPSTATAPVWGTKP